jgi:hypothetical protein
MNHRKLRNLDVSAISMGCMDSAMDMAKSRPKKNLVGSNVQRIES